MSSAMVPGRVMLAHARPAGSASPVGVSGGGNNGGGGHFRLIQTVPGRIFSWGKGLFLLHRPDGRVAVIEPGKPPVVIAADFERDRIQIISSGHTVLGRRSDKTDGIFSLTLVDNATGRETAGIPVEATEFGASPNGNIVVWSDRNRVLSIFDPQGRRVTEIDARNYNYSPSEHGAWSNTLRFSPDGSMFALTKALNSGVHIFDADGRKIWLPQRLDGLPWAAAWFSPGGNLIALVDGQHDEGTCIFDPIKKREECLLSRCQWSGHEFSPDGSLIALRSYGTEWVGGLREINGPISIFDNKGGNSTTIPGLWSHFGFSPGGEKLAAVRYIKENAVHGRSVDVHVFESPSGEIATVIPGNWGDFKFSPDSRYIALKPSQDRNDGTNDYWRLFDMSGNEIAIPPSIWVDFTPNGKYLVVLPPSSIRKGAYIIDLADNREVEITRGREITGIHFAGGDTIALSVKTSNGDQCEFYRY